ncbi:hypothetical protein OHT59_26630 [Streptomyces sp. NBC_00243]|uniref:hypothetical protein n=1 Tax=Streptomyces sp. NBC_00243 TaxID=2975688 RepID=UPI002DD8B7ED|nr:hypothetical protein [Streptomyces sp. NBC_00243]WRZ21809.1 hypothetical protein OHT59_26630 [Streptomyces sp. NBC_00243]
MTEPARRVLLAAVAGAAAAIAGCTSGGKEPTPTGSSPVTRAPSSGNSPSPSPPDPLPSASPWPFVRTEVEPQVKGAAVRLLEALGTWPRGQEGVAPAKERAAAQDVPAGSVPHLVTQAQPLLDAGPEATTRVIAAQYGGLLSARASVLVALRQWGRAAEGKVEDGGVTVDVRLTRAASGWEVSELYPSRAAKPLARPGTLIEQVVGHDRIRLPPAAEADIRAGQLRPKPLRALLTLAETYEIDVSVVHTGHPRNVFGTDRLSDHTRMRAFDVWAVDGHAVIDPATSDALIDGFMRAAAKAGAYNVGGPRQLGLPGFFSDRVHRDHLHVAFDSDV